MHCLYCLPVPPACTACLYRSPLDIERSGVPPPPKLDSYLKARVDKMYAQLSVSKQSNKYGGGGGLVSRCASK